MCGMLAIANVSLPGGSTSSVPGCSRHGSSKREARRARPCLAICVRARLRSELLELLPHTFGPQPARRWQKARLKATRLPTALARALARACALGPQLVVGKTLARSAAAACGEAPRGETPRRTTAAHRQAQQRLARALHTDLESGLLLLSCCCSTRASRCDCAQDVCPTAATAAIAAAIPPALPAALSAAVATALISTTVAAAA